MHKPSPSLEHDTQLLDQEFMHCNGAASIPGIPAELEENLSFGAADMSLPPMVDSVTNNMFKVSINQALSSTGEHLHQHSLENREIGHTEHYEISMIIPANGGGDVLSKKADEPLSSNRHAAIVKADAGSQLASDKDDDDVDDNVVDDDEEEAADDSGIDIDDDGEEEAADDSGIDIDDDDDEEEEVNDREHDSDSSSSTSSLSFSSSSSDSSDDDDEVANLHRLLNGANNHSDLVMEVESECEEGELKESPSQRKKGGLKKKTMNERSEDEEEEGLKEPARSKNKTKDLPYVPKVSVILEQYHKTVPVGIISSVVGVSLIVEGIDGQQPLNEGSILWLTDQRLPLGIVDELFGPVKKPFYVVRYNDATEVPEGAKEGMHVSYVRDFADFVLNNPDLYSKGYDEAGGDEDISDSEVDFSDDEKEAEYKRLKSRMKRENSEMSALEVENRQHQQKRAEGKHLNKDNKNRRSRGENARTFHSNNEFSGRPPRRQNARFQHHRSEREPPPFGNRVEPMQMSKQQSKHRRGNQSPVHQVQSQESLGVGQSKPSTPESSTLDCTQPQIQQLQSTLPPILQEPTLKNQLCSTSQPIQTNQLRSTSQQAQTLHKNQPRSFTQPTSQQVQSLHMNQPHNLMQSTTQQIQMNQSQGLMQSTLPQVLPWQSNQQQMIGIQHSQMPVYNQAVVAGQVAQVAIGGYGIPLANKPPMQPGTDTVQGLPPPYQSPIYQQQVPALNQFSSSMPHHFSGQGSQVLPNIGMPMGNQIQNVHANGYPMGVQPAALAAPVLGIPAGPANTPFNYSTQMVCNQNFSGFMPGCTPAFANQSLPSTYGVPEQARTMQPMAGTPAASWQQQHLPQDSSGPGPQQPFHQRPHFSDQRQGPYQGRRF